MAQSAIIKSIMRSINTLSPELIAKIAAGEVVERPASVIKELVENALDAGADQIDIELEEAGTKKIRVRDNGKGMHYDDLLLCYLPHTTSKISTDNDLISIRSFGFRGEALSSIAAVGFMTIKSRLKDQEFGHSLELNNGENITCKKIGMPIGTEIMVESLFHSTPARKKFMKDSKTELRIITEIITQVAIAFPAIGITLSHKNSLLKKEIILSVPAGQSLQNRIQSVLGQYLSEFLIPIQYESRYGSVTGYISKPQAAQQSKYHQYFYVNTRSVHDAALAKVLTESYGPLLEPRAHPPFVLYLTLPYESVDVNIHPRKEEVAFAYRYEIQNLISEAVAETLSKHNLIYTQNSRAIDMDPYTADFLKNTITPWNVKTIAEGEVLQIHNLYLLAQTEKGLLLIDQHAAHERILFEQFKEAFAQTRESQIVFELPEPLVFELSVKDTMVLDEHTETFKKIGFDIEAFGKNTFKLSVIPEIFKTRNLVQLIIEVLHDIHEGRGIKTIDRETERTLSYLACRSAIKAGDALESIEQKKLVDKLLLSDGLYTCPHGRPTHIEVSLREIDKMFKRH